MSESSSICSTTVSTDTFSSSKEKPMISLKIPKATGSFLYSVFQNKPSIVIVERMRLKRSSKLVVSSRGFTSSITRDIAITTFFGFFAALAFAFAAAAAAVASSSSSPKRSRSSSYFAALGAAFAPAHESLTESAK